MWSQGHVSSLWSFLCWTAIGLPIQWVWLLEYCHAALWQWPQHSTPPHRATRASFRGTELAYFILKTCVCIYMWIEVQLCTCVRKSETDIMHLPSIPVHSIFKIVSLTEPGDQWLVHAGWPESSRKLLILVSLVMRLQTHVITCAADDPRFSSPPTQKTYFDCRLCSLIFIVIIFYCIYIYF